MRPLTEQMPKSLLPVAGKPFIDHQLVDLARQGVSNVVLALGFLGEQVECHVGDGSRFGLKVRYAYDGDRLLGTGGAVRKASKDILGPFFVLYGDSYLQIDYHEVQRTFLASGREVLMTVFRNDGRWDKSNVIYRKPEILVYDKRINDPAMNYIDYGLQILSADLFDPYGDDQAFDLADLLSKLVEERRVVAYETTARFYEIGSSEGYSELNRLLADSVASDQRDGDGET
jgi:NDP-sugar pyrophosphorylase family protein